MSVQEFSPAEKAAALTGHALRIGGVTYHPGDRRLESERETLVLEPRLSDLLQRLISAGEPVSRDDLLNEIWGYEGSDEALTQAISKLRRALGDDRRPYRIIVTIPKFGYQLQMAASETGAHAPVRPSILEVVRRHIAERREYYKGLATGVALMAVAAVAYKLMTPPTTIEREMILCPPDAPEGSCAAMLERS